MSKSRCGETFAMDLDEVFSMGVAQRVLAKFGVMSRDGCPAAVREELDVLDSRDSRPLAGGDTGYQLYIEVSPASSLEGPAMS
jgi:hypothetical protein